MSIMRQVFRRIGIVLLLFSAPVAACWLVISAFFVLPSMYETGQYWQHIPVVRSVAELKALGTANVVAVEGKLSKQNPVLLHSFVAYQPATAQGFRVSKAPPLVVELSDGTIQIDGGYNIREAPVYEEERGSSSVREPLEGFVVGSEIVAHGSIRDAHDPTQLHTYSLYSGPYSLRRINEWKPALVYLLSDIIAIVLIGCAIVVYRWPDARLIQPSTTLTK
jgi:hypothetical protein